jgi:hypothetical protein
MDTLKARTEIHDAWACVFLADTHLGHGRCEEASMAMADAERHYRAARCGVTIVTSGSILNNLADLRIKMQQVCAAIRKKSETPTGEHSVNIPATLA